MEEQVYELEGMESYPMQVTDYKRYRRTQQPIIVDLGTFLTRAGFTDQKEPSVNFRTLVTSKNV